MKLIAQKPCNFCGRRFFVGDEIPVELVVSPNVQAKLGVLTIYNDGGVVSSNAPPEADGNTGEAVTPLRALEDQTQVTIPIETETGIQTISAAPESIIDALRIMQMDVKAAEKEIEGLKDENTLVILHACDSRKGVKNASEKKALSMFHPEDEAPNENEDMEDQLDLEDMEESVGDA